MNNHDQSDTSPRLTNAFTAAINRSIPSPVSAVGAFSPMASQAQRRLVRAGEAWERAGFHAYSGAYAYAYAHQYRTRNLYQ